MNKNKNNSVLLLLLALLVLNGIGGGGGSTADFKSPQPLVLCMFDDSPAAVQALDKEHPGQADVMSSIATGSVKDWVTKQQGGQWLSYGTGEPEPTVEMAGQPAYDAYQAWKTKYNKQVPFILAAGPSGRGYSGPPKDTQDDMRKALEPIKVK